MNPLNRFSIRFRLYFSTAFSLLLLVAVGLLGYWALESTRSTVKVLVEEKVQTLTDMNELRITLAQVRRNEKDIIISFNNAVEVATLRESWQKSLQSFNKGLVELRRTQGSDTTYTKMLDTSQAEIKAYTEGMGPVLAQIEGAQIDGSVGGAYAEKQKIHVDAIDKLLQQAATTSREEMQTAQAGIDQRTVLLSGVQIGILVLALLVLIPLTFFSVRSLTKSLAEACAVAEQIAQGNLFVPVQAQQNDEIGQLVGAMGRMQTFLRELVSQVQLSARNIHASSTEIAAGNQDLSHRTEHTAANLEETVASMAELTGNVQQSADASHEANQMAQSAAQVATRGGEVVSQVVVTMTEINASSKKIADIISVIDSIAFQTNILALNAAVEAARAGEQGRGFAVVASEVRLLAQRSAQAAKEISSLINTSVAKADEGARLVARAGTTMDDILGSVKQVTTIIRTLSTQAAGQSSSIAQISEAVGQVDQITQQNSALVEESAAASESLREQANLLANAVSRFKLEA
ncbi:methyl-accepting chemotaxis protein [Rhodoferax ferrireducens]|uniref:Methyl-accepting chemotaxis protein n=1 Tax=Rhodoferax ferrireducens TaxID=192843 RepID=A0ABU2C656_9BURK|nr:methyl-accepting chemotaxis protein [Rhodoferax ferrireducens]MDR7376825.1 methyl-accepting chemotaxis protein [Rhodoferax ferrireducens]